MAATVLVVDDALFMRSLIRDILAATGRYEVIVVVTDLAAGNATEAREAFVIEGN